VEAGPVLITHWGLSGPAILRLSAWGARELKHKDYEFKVHINWLPEHNEQSLKSFFNNFAKPPAGKKLLTENLKFLIGCGNSFCNMQE
jgi:predicted flavoprotein YhiN